MNIESFFFQGWEGIGRTALIGVIGYPLLIVLLRVSGKRTLSTMNAFDWLVTIALGSVFGSMLVNKSVALVEGVLALALLIFFQYVITWLSMRSEAFQRWVKSEPRMLLHHGRFLPNALSETRVSEEEVRAAVRTAGVAGLDQIDAVVLETNGTFSVIRSGDLDAEGVRVSPNTAGRD